MTVFVLCQLRHVIKHWTHDQHTSSNVRRGMIQQLQGIAIEGLLVGIGEDLCHSRGDDRTSRQN